MRIAALDDDPLQLEFFTHALTAMGHACRTYTTGAALLKDLRRETFDLLIVDWQLPDIEGPEIITWCASSWTPSCRYSSSPTASPKATSCRAWAVAPTTSW
jgi:DNA-binding response OmpR family regulator